MLIECSCFRRSFHSLWLLRIAQPSGGDAYLSGRTLHTALISAAGGSNSRTSAAHEILASCSCQHDFWIVFQLASWEFLRMLTDIILLKAACCFNVACQALIHIMRISLD